MEKENNFSAIHLAAALMVVLGHQFVLMGSAMPLVLGIDVNGLGVRIIFVMSGYLITESYMRSRSVAQYLKKRAVRIFPPLIVCVVLTAAVIGPIFTECGMREYLPGALDYVVKNIALYPVFDLPGVFQDNINQTAVNGSLWTLPIEVACYILLIVFMKIYALLDKRKPYIAATFYAFVGVTVWLIYVLRIIGVLQDSLIFWGTNWFSGIEVAVYFLWGSIFSRLGLRKFCNLQLAVFLCLISACVNGAFRALLLLPTITYLTLSVAFAEKPLFAKVIKTNNSYGIYLWAFPIQQVLIQLIVIRRNRYISPLAMFLIAMVFIWIISYLSSVLIEKPLLNLVKGRKDK